MDFDLANAIAVLERTPNTLRAMLDGLPTAWTDADEGPDTWSPWVIVGHLLLVLFFSATQFFLFTMGGAWSALAAGSLVFGFAFTLFEILVAILQAYVFTLLTAVYIQLAVAEEH